MINLKPQDSRTLFVERYESDDKQHVFKRVATHSGHWGYYVNGLLLDTDRYRSLLAERHNIKLEYT